MLSLLLFILSLPVVGRGVVLDSPSLYCGHFGERNRVHDRLECAVGPHQHSLEPYAFDLSNYYVEEESGKRVEGVLTRDAYTITFFAKRPFTPKQRYQLRIDLGALNKRQKIKLRLSWDGHLTGLRTFCFVGMETIEDRGTYSNQPVRGRCSKSR